MRAIKSTLAAVSWKRHVRPALKACCWLLVVFNLTAGHYTEAAVLAGSLWLW